MAGIRFAVASLLLVGCTPETAGPGELGVRCGEVVAFYLGLPSVEIAGGSAEPEEQRVRIDYRVQQAAGQREGVALCRFETAEGRATAALVDDNRLRDDEIAAFNRRLSSGY